MLLHYPEPASQTLRALTGLLLGKNATTKGKPPPSRSQDPPGPCPLGCRFPHGNLSLSLLQIKSGKWDFRIEM